jgi:hypothetical protein
MWNIILALALGAVGLALLALVLAVGAWADRRPERCPTCHARAVRLWSEVFESYPHPTPSFYRCERCGARLMRLFRGPWEDASAPEHDPEYKDAPPLPLPLTGSYRS